MFSKHQYTCYAFFFIGKLEVFSQNKQMGQLKISSATPLVSVAQQY